MQEPWLTPIRLIDRNTFPDLLNPTGHATFSLLTTPPVAEYSGGGSRMVDFLGISVASKYLHFFGMITVASFDESKPTRDRQLCGNSTFNLGNHAVARRELPIAWRIPTRDMLART